MRCLSLAASLVAVAAARDYHNSKWATHPAKTADWYAEHGLPLPELAPTITTVEPNKSYVVKLECMGCPFRVRELYQTFETWQEPPQDNSLVSTPGISGIRDLTTSKLLNFTIDDSAPALLLNGKPIAPLGPMPLEITAFQTPANLSNEVMGKMTSEQMLDPSWRLGTKFARFRLQYEHTLVATRVPGRNWIQFDVTGVHMRSQRNPGSYALDKEGQKMVQVQLRENAGTEQLYIEDVEVVERKDRVKPFQMSCGKLAMLQTDFNPLEWDYYGKIGTWSRTWHLMLWRTAHFFEANGLVLIVVALICGVVTLVRRRMMRRQEKANAYMADDAEAALLVVECDDAPPEYDDVPEFEDDTEKS